MIMFKFMDNTLSYKYAIVSFLVGSVFSVEQKMLFQFIKYWKKRKFGLLDHLSGGFNHLSLTRFFPEKKYIK